MLLFGCFCFASFVLMLLFGCFCFVASVLFQLLSRMSKGDLFAIMCLTSSYLWIGPSKIGEFFLIFSSLCLANDTK